VVGTTALGISVDIFFGALAGSGLQNGDGCAVCAPSLDCGQHVVYALDDCRLVRGRRGVGLYTNGHVEVALDDDATAACETRTQVLRDGDEGVAGFTV